MGMLLPSNASVGPMMSPTLAHPVAFREWEVGVQNFRDAC